MFTQQIILGLINVAMAGLTFIVRAVLRNVEERRCQRKKKPAKERKEEIDDAG